MLLGSDLVSTSTDIVVPAQVDIVGEVLSRHDLVVISDQAISSVNEANELDIRALGLVAEKTINNVVATRCLAAHKDKANLLGLLLVN